MTTARQKGQQAYEAVVGSAVGEMSAVLKENARLLELVPELRGLFSDPNNNAAYEPIVREAIRTRKITKPDGTIVDLRSIKSPLDPGRTLDEEIPQESTLHALGSIARRNVYANTGDSNGLLQGASFGNFFAGLIQWLLSGFEGGFEGLKQHVVAATDNSIRSGMNRDLQRLAANDPGAARMLAGMGGGDVNAGIGAFLNRTSAKVYQEAGMTPPEGIAAAPSRRLEDVQPKEITPALVQSQLAPHVRQALQDAKKSTNPVLLRLMGGEAQLPDENKLLPLLSQPLARILNDSSTRDMDGRQLFNRARTDIMESLAQGGISADVAGFIADSGASRFAKMLRPSDESIPAPAAQDTQGMLRAGVTNAIGDQLRGMFGLPGRTGASPAKPDAKQLGNALALSAGGALNAAQIDVISNGLGPKLAEDIARIPPEALNDPALMRQHRNKLRQTLHATLTAKKDEINAQNSNGGKLNEELIDRMSVAFADEITNKIRPGTISGGPSLTAQLEHVISKEVGDTFSQMFAQGEPMANLASLGTGHVPTREHGEDIGRAIARSTMPTLQREDFLSLKDDQLSTMLREQVSAGLLTEIRKPDSALNRRGGFRVTEDMIPQLADLATTKIIERRRGGAANGADNLVAMKERINQDIANRTAAGIVKEAHSRIAKKTGGNAYAEAFHPKANPNNYTVYRNRAVIGQVVADALTGMTFDRNRKYEQQGKRVAFSELTPEQQETEIFQEVYIRLGQGRHGDQRMQGIELNPAQREEIARSVQEEIRKQRKQARLASTQPKAQTLAHSSTGLNDGMLGELGAPQTPTGTRGQNGAYLT